MTMFYAESYTAGMSGEQYCLLTTLSRMAALSLKLRDKLRINWL